MQESVNTQRSPIGNLLLRTLAMPSDTNPAGDIFGGWIMSQLDIAGSTLAREIANNRVVTVAVEAMNFVKPVSVGDIVCCYGYCSKVGRTSIQVHMEMWVKKLIQIDEQNSVIERSLVTEGIYTYVSVDKNTKPKTLPENAHEIAKRGIDAASIGLNADGTPKGLDF